MRLFVPVFTIFADDGALWWRFDGPAGRGSARSATPEASVAAARGSIAHVVDAIDLFRPSVRRSEDLRWRWTLTLGGQPVVWGLGDYDRRDQGAQACHKFTLLAPLADVDVGTQLAGAARR